MDPFDRTLEVAQAIAPGLDAYVATTFARPGELLLMRRGDGTQPPAVIGVLTHNYGNETADTFHLWLSKTVTIDPPQEGS